MNPLAIKGLVGLGATGAVVTSVVLISSNKNKQNEIGEEPNVGEIQVINERIREDCGQNLQTWNEYKPLSGGEHKKQKNEKNYDEKEWMECYKKYWVNLRKK